eukprot:scaffold81429_cov59-Phaeocystis_antarctica.AAC.2
MRSVSPSACACTRASSLVSAAAALSAAAFPSGVRATYSAASSAVTKLPRCTTLPPRLTCAIVSPSACACCCASSPVSGVGAAAALAAAACPSGDRAMHSAASSAVAKQPRATDLPLRVHAEVARAVVGHAQRQPLRLRLLPRLLARQWYWRRCSPSHRRPPLRRSRDAQRRLLGGGEVAQVHHLAITPHLRLVGLVTAGVIEVHAEVARLAIVHEQRQPLRLGLLPRLLAHQRSPTRRDRYSADANWRRAHMWHRRGKLCLLQRSPTPRSRRAGCGRAARANPTERRPAPAPPAPAPPHTMQPRKDQ